MSSEQSILEAERNILLAPDSDVIVGHVAETTDRISFYCSHKPSQSFGWGGQQRRGESTTRHGREVEECERVWVEGGGCVEEKLDIYVIRRTREGRSL